MVFSHSEAMVSLFSLPLPNNRNFLFYSATQANLILFTYIVNYQTLKNFIRNASNEFPYISRRYKLGHLMDIAYNNCFLTNTQSTLDTATSPLSSY